MTYTLDPTTPLPIEEEYPEIAEMLLHKLKQSYPFKVAKFERVLLGRNEVCDCGSDKKFKRCCALVKPNPHGPGWWSMRITTFRDKEVDIAFGSDCLVRKRKPSLLPALIGATTFLYQKR